jgi:hypothetical protein
MFKDLYNLDIKRPYIQQSSWITSNNFTLDESLCQAKKQFTPDEMCMTKKKEFIIEILGAPTKNRT